MCDSARCPQATHHSCHRPTWTEHAERTKTFLGQIGVARKTEQTRLQTDYDRALRVVAELDTAKHHYRQGIRMRISAAQRTENENRILAAIDRLPPGGRCDVKTLAVEASVDRAAFYGNRPYARLETSTKTEISARSCTRPRREARGPPQRGQSAHPFASRIMSQVR
jgi:hypothetical protein